MGASSISINPLTLSQRKLFKPGTNQPNIQEFALFLSDLGQWANQIQQTLMSPLILASLLNGNADLFSSALKQVMSVTTQVGNLSVACDNASSVFVMVIWSAATNTVLTLTHLPLGIPVYVQFANASVGSNNYSIAATDQGGTAYAEVGTVFASATTGAIFASLASPVALTNGNRISLSGMSGGSLGVGRLYFAA